VNRDRAPRLEDLPDALTEAEVLGVIPVSRPTLRKLRQSGAIRAVYAGRRVLYPKTAVREYLGLSA
jgi:excisionase family DNA binding protein